MKPASMATVFAIAIGGILATAPAMADKGGRHDRRDDDRESRDANHRQSAGSNRHFDERQHAMVHEYYAGHSGRRCPPGLAKKHNGCMPPGQARKWTIGRPLAREVIYYEVPQPLALRIGPPPAGHRYVRVAGDILLMAIGTGMIVDAINDLGRT